MLRGLDHEVSGLALDSLPHSLFLHASLAELVADDVRTDARDAHAVGAAVKRCAPDVVIHMAAQPLVRASYLDPRTTMEGIAVDLVDAGCVVQAAA